MILNINQLRAFYSASRRKSVTLAAEEMMVTPPAISMQVRKLEETLEIKLMFREGNSLQLTDMGRTLFNKCDKIFKQIKELEDYLEDMSTSKVGELKIGCPQTPAKYVMPRLIAIFKKTYPGVKIVFEQGNNSGMIKSILNHKNELAVVRCRGDEKKLKVRSFGSEPLVLVAAPKSQYLHTDAISIAQLSSIPLIVPQEGSATRDVVFEYLRKLKVTPMIVMESGSADLIKELVSQDNGVSFLVKSAVLGELENNKLRPIQILDGSPTMEYGIGYLKRTSLSPGAWAFLRHLDKLENILPIAQ
ncbi:MAG: LysR family transcriptional regulator [Deltaproteobacteria bacterium]|nr:LysR family transcriptional regulator [Deltaproteobacteria bacterium]